jgi:alpha-glucosidase
MFTFLLTGIASKMDYFSDTGINAIWLSPIYKSPMVDFGYDISDYKAIDSTFGSMSDFEALMKKTKDSGEIILKDMFPV